MRRLWLKFAVIAGCAAVVVCIGLLLITSPFGDGERYMGFLFWLLLLGAPLSLAVIPFDSVFDVLGHYSVAISSVVIVIFNWMVLGAVVGWVTDFVRRRVADIRA
jgi:hypothetical protein